MILGFLENPVEISFLLLGAKEKEGKRHVYSICTQEKHSSIKF